MPTKANLKPLIDHAIGALGDLHGEIGIYRSELRGIKKKHEWTQKEFEALRTILKIISGLCGQTVEQWEEAAGVSIPKNTS